MWVRTDGPELYPGRSTDVCLTYNDLQLWARPSRRPGQPREWWLWETEGL